VHRSAHQLAHPPTHTFSNRPHGRRGPSETVSRVLSAPPLPPPVPLSAHATHGQAGTFSTLARGHTPALISPSANSGGAYSSPSAAAFLGEFTISLPEIWR
jgi:hypothetical protein